MSTKPDRNRLPTNLDNIIHCRTIENERVEFKAGWDKHIKGNVVRSICAFANDLLNNNGGYIILGIEEHNGRPILPPCGLDDANVDRTQREIIGACKGTISPEYLPHVFVEEFQEKTILVIWAPAGENRPYDAPQRTGKGKAYWVRSAGATIEATGDLRRQLLEQAAKIPYDDRRSLTAKIEDISPILLNKFLSDSKSRLAEMRLTAEEIAEKMNIVARINDHKIPRNVALIFFSEDPEKFFRGARIDMVQFGDDAGGDLLEEKEFRGSLPEQVRSCLNYLEGIDGSIIEKVPGQAEVERFVPYPYPAIEEAVVNAVYHRSYEFPPEPVKVYLYPDRMEITSYPGPVPGIRLDHFEKGRLPAVPARNRRIGELLKDLRLAEGRGTGIAKIRRKMEENGSPAPLFDFDEDHTYFTVILPVHPRFYIFHAGGQASHLWHIGKKSEAVSHLKRALQSQPESGILVGQLIEYAFELGDRELAGQALDNFDKQQKKNDPVKPYLAMVKGLLDYEMIEEAEERLKKLPPLTEPDQITEAATLKKRIVQSYNNTATKYKDLSQFQEALEYYLKAIYIEENILEKDLPSLATSYNNAAMIYQELGDYRKAIEYHEQALAIDEQVFGKEHPAVARDLNNLGAAWSALGEKKKAISYYEAALVIDEREYGKEHPAVARDLNNLGAAWDDLGDKKKAISYFEAALAIDERLYGKKHPNVAIRLNNLGAAWSDLGDKKKAISYYEAALAIWKAVYGDTHPQVAAALNNLGEAWRGLGEPKKAISYYEQALAIDERVYGSEHPNVAIRLNNLGGAYFEMGDKQRAKGYFEMAYHIFNKFFGDEHPQTIIVKEWLEKW